MKNINLFLISLYLLMSSCNSQNRENPQNIGQGTFHLDRITFKEKKDTLFSKVSPIVESNKNIDIYFIESDKEETMLGNELLNFSRMDWYINKHTKEIVALEIWSIKIPSRNYENVLKNLEKKFEKIDLTNQKAFNISKKISKAYTYTYLFKSKDKYLLIDYTVFEKDRNDDNFRIKIYKYPFDKNLVGENLVDKSILNQ